MKTHHWGQTVQTFLNGSQQINIGWRDIDNLFSVESTSDVLKVLVWMVLFREQPNISKGTSLHRHKATSFTEMRRPSWWARKKSILLMGWNCGWNRWRAWHRIIRGWQFHRRWRWKRHLYAVFTSMFWTAPSFSRLRSVHWRRIRYRWILPEIANIVIGIGCGNYWLTWMEWRIWGAFHAWICNRARRYRLLSTTWHDRWTWTVLIDTVKTAPLFVSRNPLRWKVHSNGLASRRLPFMSDARIDWMTCQTLWRSTSGVAGKPVVPKYQTVLSWVEWFLWSFVKTCMLLTLQAADKTCFVEAKFHCIAVIL